MVIWAVIVTAMIASVLLCSNCCAILHIQIGKVYASSSAAAFQTDGSRLTSFRATSVSGSQTLLLHGLRSKSITSRNQGAKPGQPARTMQESRSAALSENTCTYETVWQAERSSLPVAEPLRAVRLSPQLVMSIRQASGTSRTAAMFPARRFQRKYGQAGLEKLFSQSVRACQAAIQVIQKSASPEKGSQTWAVGVLTQSAQPVWDCVQHPALGSAAGLSAAAGVLRTAVLEHPNIEFSSGDLDVLAHATSQQQLSDADVYGSAMRGNVICNPRYSVFVIVSMVTAVRSKSIGSLSMETERYII